MMWSLRGFETGIKNSKSRLWVRETWLNWVIRLKITSFVLLFTLLNTCTSHKKGRFSTRISYTLLTSALVNECKLKLENIKSWMNHSSLICLCLKIGSLVSLFLFFPVWSLDMIRMTSHPAVFIIPHPLFCHVYPVSLFPVPSSAHQILMIMSWLVPYLYDRLHVQIHLTSICTTRISILKVKYEYIYSSLLSPLFFVALLITIRCDDVILNHNFRCSSLPRNFSWVPLFSICFSSPSPDVVGSSSRRLLIRIKSRKEDARRRLPVFLSHPPPSHATTPSTWKRWWSWWWWSPSFWKITLAHSLLEFGPPLHILLSALLLSFSLSHSHFLWYTKWNSITFWWLTLNDFCLSNPSHYCDVMFQRIPRLI